MRGITAPIVIMSILAVTFLCANVIYIFVNSTKKTPTITIELVDNYCANETAYFVVRNSRNNSLASDSLSCVKNDDSCKGACVVDNLPPSGAGYVRVYNCSSGLHTFKLTGTTNILSLSTFC